SPRQSSTGFPTGLNTKLTTRAVKMGGACSPASSVLKPRIVDVENQFALLVQVWDVELKPFRCTLLNLEAGQPRLVAGSFPVFVVLGIKPAFVGAGQLGGRIGT